VIWTSPSNNWLNVVPKVVLVPLLLVAWSLKKAGKGAKTRMLFAAMPEMSIGVQGAVVSIVVDNSVLTAATVGGVPICPQVSSVIGAAWARLAAANASEAMMCFSFMSFSNVKELLEMPFDWDQLRVNSMHLLAKLMPL
jgi:hypothetical protein